MVEVRRDPSKADRWPSRLVDTALSVHVALFIILYSTDAVFALLAQVPILRSPVQLFCLMAVPILLRVHWPDYRRSGYPFHSPNSGRLADILGVMMEW